MPNEDNVFKQAEIEEKSLLRRAEEDRRNHSLRLLHNEARIFSEGMTLQRAGFKLLNEYAPFSDPRTRSSISLAALVYDGLRRGWLDILEGYYAFGMSNLRIIEEARCFEIAVSYTKKSAKLWLNGKLDIGEARKIIVREMEKEKVGIGVEWERDHVEYFDFL